MFTTLGPRVSKKSDKKLRADVKKLLSYQTTLGPRNRDKVIEVHHQVTKKSDQRSRVSVVKLNIFGARVAKVHHRFKLS